MAIAHVCRACCGSLTRIRAPLEPALGLPVVVCPRCGVADARRRHPLVVMWRAACRARVSLFALVGRIGVLAVLFWGSFVASHQVLDTFGGAKPIVVARHVLGVDPIDGFRESWIARDRVTVAISAFIWFAMVGALLTAAIPHIAGWKKWVGFIAALGVIATMIPVFEWARSHDEQRLPTGQVVVAPARTPFRSSRITARVQEFEVLGACMFVAICGMPLGRMANRLVSSRASRRWRRRLVKARSRRARA